MLDSKGIYAMYLRNDFFKSVFTDIEYWREDREGPIELTFHWRY